MESETNSQSTEDTVREILKEGSTFRNWDEASDVVYNHAKILGFNLCKSRKKECGGELRKRTFICERSGKPQKNKEDKQPDSKKILCPWHVNLSLPEKNNVEKLIIVTKFVDHHNHELHPKDFTVQVIQDVEILTKHCKVGAVIQRKYLRAKYPGHLLSNQDLSNVIGRFKTSREVLDVIKVFNHLIKQKDDSGWKEEPKTIITDTERAMDVAVKSVYRNCIHRYSIWHLLYSNSYHHVNKKLGSKHEKFLEDFFKCQNSLQEEIFLQGWQCLMKDYPEIVDYLTNTLYENRNYWAKAFVVETFTANLDSIFHVEVINSVISTTLANLQIPIFDLIDHINNQLEDHCRQIYEKHDQEIIRQAIFKTNDPRTMTLYELVNMQIERYLSAVCVNLQLHEMELSLNFIAKKYDIGLIKNIEKIFVAKRYFVVNDYYLPLSKIFSMINTNEILETWSVYDQHDRNFILLMNDGYHWCTCLNGIHYGLVCKHYFRVMTCTPKARFQITMISKRWYKENCENDPNFEPPLTYHL
ncbi:17882_t:CDS:2 [Funneliformis caledonium]|uniref:17882_t:CDS:1 n=1 Tax=Funneliformis caledonium TaxID=1117310 RepID=A0A9N9EXX0_9GLOM|nr:17882_t:CDS:2 [Funneliformis caledonium]